MVNAYSQAGVDVEAGYEVVARIRNHVERTSRAGVMGTLGGFGGCFDLSSLNVREPILVSGTDGVGTKLLLAQASDIHDTIGIDCVAMCVNDIVAQGAQPLYFLDYIATGRTDPRRMEAVVAGVAEGCVQARCALIGGETAEMPGMYQPEEYDLAGFAVGVVEKSQLVTGADIAPGDVLVGLPSSGVHSNGFSLVRKVITEWPTRAAELLEPTRIYVEAVLPLVEAGFLKGAAHITGGGFVENIPRMLPSGLGASIELGSWPIPPIFSELRERAEIPTLEMYEIFNMGIGMVLAFDPAQLSDALALLRDQGEAAYVIGAVTEVPAGANPLLFCGGPQ